jgi:hypothetical protein
MTVTADRENHNKLRIVFGRALMRFIILTGKKANPKYRKASSMKSLLLPGRPKSIRRRQTGAVHLCERRAQRRRQSTLVVFDDEKEIGEMVQLLLLLFVYWGLVETQRRELPLGSFRYVRNGPKKSNRARGK